MVGISGDLSVGGNLRVGGEMVKTWDDARIKALEEECVRTKAQLENLEKKLTELWFAPGMPGFTEAEGNWQSNLLRVRDLPRGCCATKDNTVPVT